MNDKILHIIGGGLAGSEAAWQAANKGCKIFLYEMRSEKRKTDAHHTDKLAELVCSNSFRNDEISSAIGLLHEEMRKFGSIIMEAAEATRIPAGGALAMDREGFAEYVTQKISNHPNITLVRKEIESLPKASEMEKVIIASGPLTSMNLANDILNISGEESLAFYDAIAPIIHKETINFDVAWFQSRYNKGTGKDYINLPLNEEQYYNFIEELLEAERIEFKDWEKNTPFFDGCLPIEEMAKRGKDTLLFGPMKPVGLDDPRTGRRPFAVVQLRQDNKLGTLYNMVGFQTKLKYGDQKKIFSKIPGLENAEFARLGGLHRNTFINSPKLLDESMQFKKMPHIRFAGQITGVEGYVESAATGLLTGYFAACDLMGEHYALPPQDTALGALLNHVTGGANSETFQPMNVNFGLFPPLGKKIKKLDRKKAYADRALESLDNWLGRKEIMHG